MESSMQILMTGNNRIICTKVEDYLQNLGHQVEVTRDGDTTLERISTQNYDLALIDLRSPDLNSIELLRKIQEHQKNMPVVLISGAEIMKILIKVFRLDTVIFLPRSIQLPGFGAGRKKGKQTDNPRILHANLGIQNQYLVGNSRAMQQVRERIRKAVEANVDTIFITGETGTGKEVVAREIHLQGSSDEQPFVAVNCSALPESLVESELFGHVEGAFTGAATDRTGYFELANNGTLFLDEIADLGVHIQAKLLRILETRTLIRVGGTQEIAFQERVISAFNRDPAPLIKSGQFRNDLFHRLNIFPIHLTPLRERPEDILPLANHFLETYIIKSGRIFDGFSDGAKSALLGYQYPGNVRELRNIVERTAILCPQEISLIEAEHLDIQGNVLEEVPLQADQSAPKNEYEWITQALEHNRWNRRQAAKELGLPYSTFRFKMNKLGIS